MPRFYVTFGQKSPFRDGYVLIEADDKATARAEALYSLGQSWAFIYDEKGFNESKSMYPDGQIGATTILPSGYKHD